MINDLPSGNPVATTPEDYIFLANEALDNSSPDSNAITNLILAYAILLTGLENQTVARKSRRN